jgi:hypothetical protein
MAWFLEQPVEWITRRFVELNLTDWKSDWSNTDQVPENCLWCDGNWSISSINRDKFRSERIKL